MEIITSQTGLLGLIGDPVAHSKSPEMVNAALKRLGLPYVYLAFRVAPNDLGKAVQGLKALNVAGFNVTIPHKVAIMKELDELDATADQIGAVNTVVNREGKWIGYNTDGPGYLRSLQEELALPLAEQEVVLLGAGGAARAVGYALAAAGVRKVAIANRTVEKAEALKEHLARFAEVDAIAIQEAEEVIKRATLVVNTTSVGMHPHTKQMPIPGAWLHDGHIVSDLIYHPRETALLRAARQKGARIHTGLGMLVHQAAIALELWLKEKVPVDWMKQVLEASLTGTNIKEA